MQQGNSEEGAVTSWKGAHLGDPRTHTKQHEKPLTTERSQMINENCPVTIERFAGCLGERIHQFLRLTCRHFGLFF
jgi:hypothetical protein